MDLTPPGFGQLSDRRQRVTESEIATPVRDRVTPVRDRGAGQRFGQISDRRQRVTEGEIATPVRDRGGAGSGGGSGADGMLRR